MILPSQMKEKQTLADFGKLTGPMTESQERYAKELLAETATPFQLPENTSAQQASEIIETLKAAKYAMPRPANGVPNLTLVESSNIRAIGYRYGGTIFIRFVNNTVYSFEGSADLFLSLLTAESKGKFFAANIKKLPYKKLSDDNPLPEVPEGYYAIEQPDKLRFYQVYRHQYTKKITVKECFGAPGGLTKVLIREPRSILKRILKLNAAESQKLFASELGCCYYCGSPLTDELSRKRGIGPICYDKYGEAIDDSVDSDEGE